MANALQSQVHCRLEAVEILTERGGIYQSRVTRQTDILLVGKLRQPTSNKLTHAEALRQSSGKKPVSLFAQDLVFPTDADSETADGETRESRI